jgi:hypothetical protein
MGRMKQPKSVAESRGDRHLQAASLVLCSVLTGCAWGSPAPSASAPPPTAPVSQAAVPGPPPTEQPTATAAPTSDGVHPNQSLTDLFRGSTTSTARASSNVPHPPSTYTPEGQPYTPPGQPAYGSPQNAGDAAATESAEESDGVHPNQSLTDLFRR